MNPARPSSVQRFMRTRFLVFAAAIAAGIAVASGARADDNFDVSVASGQVTLVAKGDFHINQDYPWKLIVGDVKLDKTKFSLSEKTASISGAPKGTGTLRGAVCSKDQCMKVEKQVTIQ